MSYQIAQFDLRRLTNLEPLVPSHDEPNSTFSLLSKETPGSFLFSIQTFDEFFTWGGRTVDTRVIGLRSERQEYLFKASSFGSYSATIGSRRQTIDMERGCMIECHKNTRLDIEGGNESYGFGISERRISKALTQFYGRPVPLGFAFDCEVPMDAPFMPPLRNIIRLFKEDALTSQRMNRSILASSMFEDSIAMFIVENFRHSMSGLNESEEKTLAPRQVRRAMEFAIANASDPLTVTQMASVAGVSVRTLQINFKKFLNRSPIEFLREERLKRCRREIMVADPMVRIYEIAARWGFLHPSRFSALYKRTFGCSPSEEVSSQREQAPHHAENSKKSGEF